MSFNLLDLLGRRIAKLRLVREGCMPLRHRMYGSCRRTEPYSRTGARLAQAPVLEHFLRTAHHKDCWLSSALHFTGAISVTTETIWADGLD